MIREDDGDEIMDITDWRCPWCGREVAAGQECGCVDTEDAQPPYDPQEDLPDEWEEI